jgi:hypothetical protein
MKIIFIIFIYLSIFSSNIYSQSDTLNENYFKNIQLVLKNDSSIKDVRYICEKYKNGIIEAQHIYVKFNNDSIDRYWRLGKCFHYYKNGKMKTITNVDLLTKTHNSIDINFTENGDTSWTSVYENYNSKMVPFNTIFSQAGFGKIYEMTTDKYTDIKYKNGIKHKSVTYDYVDDGWLKVKAMFYKNVGSIGRIEDYNDRLIQVENYVRMKNNKTTPNK